MNWSTPCWSSIVSRTPTRPCPYDHRQRTQQRQQQPQLRSLPLSCHSNQRRSSRVRHRSRASPCRRVVPRPTPRVPPSTPSSYAQRLLQNGKRCDNSSLHPSISLGRSGLTDRCWPLQPANRRCSSTRLAHLILWAVDCRHLTLPTLSPAPAHFPSRHQYPARISLSFFFESLPLSLFFPPLLPLDLSPSPSYSSLSSPLLHLLLLPLLLCLHVRLAPFPLPFTLFTNSPRLAASPPHDPIFFPKRIVVVLTNFRPLL